MRSRMLFVRSLKTVDAIIIKSEKPAKLRMHEKIARLSLLSIPEQTQSPQ